MTVTHTRNNTAIETKQFRHKELLIRSRSTIGVDWGGERQVLVSCAKMELWWIKSHKTWVNRMDGHQYQPGRLMLIADADIGYPPSKTIQEGGRLSLNMIRTHEKQIDDFFGIAGITGQICTGKTLIVEDTKSELPFRQRVARGDYEINLPWLNEMFKRDAIREVGLEGHPKAEGAYKLAWQYGHGSGFNEVLQCLEDIAELLLPARAV